MNDALQPEPVLATVAENQSPTPATLGHEPVVASLATEAEPIVPAAIEQRLEALEKKVDHLNNSPELEERITTRVLERLPQAPEQPRWYKRLNPFRGKSIPMPSGWVVYDLFNEIRFVLAMTFDRRYGMTWMSRGILAAAFAVALMSGLLLSPISLLVSWIPLLGPWIVWTLDKLLVLFCGGLIFKILHRETERYRKFLESLTS